MENYIIPYRPRHDRWLTIARLRFAPIPDASRMETAVARRDYRRRLKRFLYNGSAAVMIEGVVERKSWLHHSLSDLTVLVWHGATENAAREAASRDLDRLTRELAEHDDQLTRDGRVRIALACALVGSDTTNALDGEPLHQHVHELLGATLANRAETTLAQHKSW